MSGWQQTSREGRTLGQGVFGSREVPLSQEVAVYITENNVRQLVGVVVPPGERDEHPESGNRPSGPGLIPRPATLAITDGIRKSQARQAPLVISDPFGVWDPAWGELRPHQAFGTKP